MDSDRLAGYWQTMYIVTDELGGDYPLAAFFNIKDCLGQHKGGVLFLVINERGEEESLILRSDENDYCYKKIADTGDEDKDWEFVGVLTENLDSDFMPPYT